MCDMDCFHCKYKDCRNNKITDSERKSQDVFDINCINERIKEERKPLRKGNLKFYDYNHSDKGKARRKKYEQSPKGKAKAKRKAQKDIESGKNAERCRAYYYRKKAERKK